MRHRSRPVRQIAALALVPLALAIGGAAEPAKTGGVNVKVTATNLRNANGVVRACMTTNAKRFPKCRGDANAYRVVVPAAKKITFTFKNVTPGKYAIALLHDENGNGKADRAMGMMPKEGFGFSRDAKVRMAPPSFRDAVFTIGKANTSQTIKMRYML